MSYYSNQSYATRDPWFMSLYFNRWFKRMVGPILDIGCAAGDFIAVKPDIVEGIDMDDDNLARAKAKGFNVKKIDVDTNELKSLESDRYEGVMAGWIIEHLHHPLRFLEEIRRVLKPGGTAIILTPNCPRELVRFWDDHTHVRPFTKKSLKMIAYDAGFTDIKISEDFKCLPGMGLLVRTFKLSPEFIGRLQRIVGIRGQSLILEVKKGK